VVVKSGTYPWLGKDVKTYAVASVLATNIKGETPEQHQAIIQLLNDIHNNIGELRKNGHEKWKEVDFDFSHLKWPVYEGANNIFK